MAGNSLAELRKGFSRGGRAFLSRYVPFVEGARHQDMPVSDRLPALAKALLSVQGEASAIAIAADFLDSYAEAIGEERLELFRLLADRYGPEQAALKAACEAYGADPSDASLSRLVHAVEPPRRELFRRLNLAPGGTSRLVAMRTDLLVHLRRYPGLAPVDADLEGLLQSWFNRGFLEMRRLSWSSPADVLERIIRYEAVHSIRDWADLRSRLDPPDRRCFAFFHPAMPGEPLIFVEVALTSDVPNDIQAILERNRIPMDVAGVRCAVFYSISNCQKGLQGISFGSFLIKQVASDLASELPQLDQFVTLSPAPGLVGYLHDAARAVDIGPTPRIMPEDVVRLTQPGWWDDPAVSEALRVTVLPHVIRYFLEAKRADGKPRDPVARFHLGNGARLERINWLADRSANGLGQSGGVMVNYLYALAEVEENHEAFSSHGAIAAGKPVRQLVRSARASDDREGIGRDVLARLTRRKRQRGRDGMAVQGAPIA